MHRGSDIREQSSHMVYNSICSHPLPGHGASADLAQVILNVNVHDKKKTCVLDALSVAPRRYSCKHYINKIVYGSIQDDVANF